jgi:hypothetical protein
METRLDPVGDHPRAIAPRRRRGRPGDPQGKEEPDAIGAPEVQILANDRFEEVAALHGTREDLRQTDFELLEREAVRVAGGVIRWADGRREPGDPPIEERLHVGGPERLSRLSKPMAARRSCCLTHSWPLRHSLMADFSPVRIRCGCRRSAMPVMFVRVNCQCAHHSARHGASELGLAIPNPVGDFTLEAQF